MRRRKSESFFEVMERFFAQLWKDDRDTEKRNDTKRKQESELKEKSLLKMASSVH